MQWWRVVGAIGRFMMRAGVLVLLFVAYQLWGTGLSTHQAQDRLKSEFADQLATSTTTTELPPTSPSSTTPPVTAPADLPTPANGDPIGHIRIPAIGVDFIVIQGVDISDLKEGPGHFPQTPLPGQPGNVALAGHRTTYLAPFNRFDELKPGDPVIFEMADGWYTYKVVDSEIVQPTATWVINNPYPDKRAVGRSFTFTTCNPKYSARQRLVVYGTFVSHRPFDKPPADVVPVKGG